MNAIANIRGLGLISCTIIEVRGTEVDVVVDGSRRQLRTYLKEEIANWDKIERAWKSRKR